MTAAAVTASAGSDEQACGSSDMAAIRKLREKRSCAQFSAESSCVLHRMGWRPCLWQEHNRVCSHASGVSCHRPPQFNCTTAVGPNRSTAVRQFSCLPDSRGRSLLLKPIRWLHIPKTGESIASVLVPLGCSSSSGSSANSSAVFPPTAGVQVDARWIARYGTPGKGLARWFSTCLGDLVPSRCRMLAGGFRALVYHSEWHVGIDQREAEGMETLNYVTFMRDPYRRLISSYHHLERRTRDCPACRSKPSVSLIDFASSHVWSAGRTGPAGCAVKMLVGRDCAGRYPSRDEVNEAKRRLRRFTFGPPPTPRTVPCGLPVHMHVPLPCGLMVHVHAHRMCMCMCMCLCLCLCRAGCF